MTIYWFYLILSKSISVYLNQFKSVYIYIYIYISISISISIYRFIYLNLSNLIQSNLILIESNLNLIQS